MDTTDSVDAQKPVTSYVTCTFVYILCDKLRHIAKCQNKIF